MQDKTKIIEKIATAPECLSFTDIQAITEDDELKALYEGAALISYALIDVPDFDADKSLARLHSSIADNGGLPDGLRPIQRVGKRTLGYWSGKKAAVTIGILLTAMAVIAAICLVPTSAVTPTTPVTAKQDMAETPETQSATPAVVKLCYDDAPLSQILDDIAKRYDCSVQYTNTEACDCRYHITIPADATLVQVAEMLNAFDEVKITVNGSTIIVE